MQSDGREPLKFLRCPDTGATDTKVRYPNERGTCKQL